MIKKVFKGIGMTLALVFFIWVIVYAIVETTKEFLSEYDILDTVDSPAVVTEKFSEKGLFWTPAYFVRVDLNENSSSNEIENRVFSWQFKQLEVGDTISGYYVRGEHFVTVLDVITDSIIAFVLLFVFLLFVVFLICWPIFAFIENRKKKNKLPQIVKAIYRRQNARKKRKAKKPDSSLKEFLRKAIVPITVVILILSINGFILNSIQKISPIGKTKTEAIVTNAILEEREYYGFGHRYTDPYYSLTLSFTDAKNEEYKVIKEVTGTVYRKVSIGDKIKISYITGNPNNVFIPTYSLFPLLEMLTYAKFMLCVLILMLISLYPIMKLKKRRWKFSKGKVKK